MYGLQYSSDCEEKIKKASKENAGLQKAIEGRLREIIKDPYKFKQLPEPLQKQRMVHLLGKFIMTYFVDTSTNTIKIVTFEHYDEIFSVKKS
jgi:mRNA-degrading endonuclease RelE of RelBE toxin-antitoxin system